ncbi:unnamed protein product [Litomosoides sigmodontis]|uniref:Uncharacterized protein n=1 Tax=Litomosoides sigmodontis TaxID=42156 RepID=A0A3P6UGC2_LITSI|nr:unnamed protein product [Litomosoides sigmodontis]
MKIINNEVYLRLQAGGSFKQIRCGYFHRYNQCSQSIITPYDDDSNGCGGGDNGGDYHKGVTVLITATDDKENVKGIVLRFNDTMLELFLSDEKITLFEFFIIGYFVS